MTLPRLAALGRYWRKHPPAHVLLAALAGYRAPPDHEERGDGRDAAALVAWYKATGGRV